MADRTKEIWRPIVGYEKFYEVSNYGNVRSLDRFIGKRFFPSKLLHPSIQRGYCYVCLSRPNKFPRERLNWKVHLLVLEAFCWKRPDSKQCAHNDGNPGNNNLYNLRYATVSENHADKIKHGTHLFGEAHGSAKLKNIDIMKIRKMRGQYTQDKIAKIYNVSAVLISKIQRKKIWKHI